MIVDLSTTDLIEQFEFPMGEPHVRVNIDPEVREITLLYRWGDTDVLTLALVVDALHAQNPGRVLHLLCPYFPFARQYRVANPGEPVSVRAFADLINSMGFSTVTVVDPHSSVTPACIKRVRVIPQHEGASLAVAHWAPNIIVAPDAGAAGKAQALGQRTGVRVVYATKRRDSWGGALTEVSAPRVSGCALVVDDICDGGATFINLAQAILEQSPSAELALYVTHGGFTKGLDSLLKYYRHIYTTDSFSVKAVQNPHLTVFPVYGT